MNKYLSEMIKNTPRFVVQTLESIAESESQLSDLLEDFIERAGVMEFEGQVPRFQAEKKALELVKENHNKGEKNG